MSNSINWMGNKVLDSGTSRQPSGPSSQPSGQQSWANPAPSYIPPAGQSPMTYTPAPTMPAPAPIAPMPVQTAPAPAPTTPMPSSGEDLSTVQGPPPAAEEGFIPYYLASNIGRTVRAEFIVGTSQYVDKAGVIKEVGINYFVLHDTNARADIMCDLYSVKFVTIPRA